MTIETVGISPKIYCKAQQSKPSAGQWNLACSFGIVLLLAVYEWQTCAMRCSSILRRQTCPEWSVVEWDKKHRCCTTELVPVSVGYALWCAQLPAPDFNWSRHEVTGSCHECLQQAGPDHPWGWWGWSLRARTPIGARTARYNENLESRTNLGPGISTDKICGLLMMNVSMPCLSWLLKTT